jgi:lipopolysaccharide heptosyltransferase II
LVKRLGLWDTTEFLGNQKDVPAILSHLHCVVLATTTHEAFGRVIVEAQALGVPVVATEVGGVIDIIQDEKTGLLVPPEDPQRMADAVIRIFQDEGLAKYIVAAAYRQVCEKFNLKAMVEKTLAVYEEASTQFKILVVKLSSLGDVILATASLRAIKEKFGKNYFLSVLVGEEAKEVLLRCPYIDELIVYDTQNRDKGLRGVLRLARKLRKKNFDVVIDLQNNRKSHLLSFLSMAVARYGYDRKWGRLLTHRIKDDRMPLSPVQHQGKVLNLLGVHVDDERLELWPSPEDERCIEEFLKSQWLAENQQLIGINMSASKRWKTKNWPLRHIAKLCEVLGKEHKRVVITGTDVDKDYMRRLMDLLKESKPIDACGKTTINQLASLIKKCAVYISPDSAALHIAAAMGTPFIALFGPTHAQRHLPPAREFVVIHKGVPCSPCYKTDCSKLKCMEQITPEEVKEAIDTLLKKKEA